jgi:hypothetical protein
MTGLLCLWFTDGGLFCFSCTDGDYYVSPSLMGGLWCLSFKGGGL